MTLIVSFELPESNVRCAVRPGGEERRDHGAKHVNDHIRRPAARSAFASMAGAFVPASSETRNMPAARSSDSRSNSAMSTIFLSQFGEDNGQTLLHRGTDR